MYNSNSCFFVSSVSCYSADKDWVRVKQFLIDLEFIEILQGWFFNSDILEKRYQTHEMELMVGDMTWTFKNFYEAVYFLYQYTDEMLEEYEKLKKITKLYNLYEQSKTVIMIRNQSITWMLRNSEYANVSTILH